MKNRGIESRKLKGTIHERERRLVMAVMVVVVVVIMM